MIKSHKKQETIYIYIYEIALLLLFTFIGLVLNKIIVSKSGCIGLDNNRLFFGNSEIVASNLVYWTISDFLDCFNLKTVVQMDLIGMPLYIGKLSFALIILCISFISVKHFINNINNEDKNIVFLFIFLLIMILVSISFHTLCIKTNERYLFQAVLGMFALCGLLLATIKIDNRIISICILLISLFFTVEKINNFSKGINEKNKWNEVCEILKGNKAYSGFANMEVAVPIEVISNGDIKASYIKDNQLYNFNCEKDSYKKPNNNNNFYAIYNKDDYHYLIKDGETIAKPLRTIEYKDVYILIFEIDLWDTYLENKEYIYK